jgi:hypothetical protein
MTIAERKAREAHDRENPWRPMGERPPVGLICNLLFNDMLGDFAADGLRFFLGGDGEWHRMDAGGAWCMPKPINWRPAYCFLTAERRALLMRAGKRGN